MLVYCYQATSTAAQPPDHEYSCLPDYGKLSEFHPRCICIRLLDGGDETINSPTCSESTHFSPPLTYKSHEISSLRLDSLFFMLQSQLEEL